MISKEQQERLKYFRLAEPAIRKEFQKDRTLSPDIYSKYGIREEEIPLFETIYSHKWLDNIIDDFFDEIDDGHVIDPIERKKLYLTDNSYFFQFGVNSLDVARLRRLIGKGNTHILIDKNSGHTMGGSSLKSVYADIDVNQYHNYVKIEIPNLVEFIDRLKQGDIESVLQERIEVNYDWQYKVPSDIELSRYIEVLDVEDFISILEQDKPVIKYSYVTSAFTAFESIDNFNEHQNHMKELNSRTQWSHLLMTVNNRKRVIYKLKQGEMYVLNEIVDFRDFRKTL